MKTIDPVVKEIYYQYLNDDEQLEKILNDIEDVSPYFIDKIRQYETNRRYYKGDHYLPHEIEIMRQQYREPVIMNEIQVKVDHQIGSHEQTILDTKVVARENTDELKSQILDFILKWCEQINGVPNIESYVYQDALIDGVGATIVRWKFEDMEYGYPSVEIIPAEELVFDLNAKYPDLRDARWIARVPLVTAADLAEMFPDKYDVIEKYNDQIFAVPRYKLPNIMEKRLAPFRNDIRKYVPFIEYFEYIKIYKYVVEDGIQDRKYIFNYENEATEFHDGLVEEYLKGEKSIVGPDGRRLITQSRVIETAVEHTLVIGNEIISRDILALPKIPIQVAFSYFKSGDFWSYVETMIPVQKMINNTMSTYDHILGSSAKNPTLVVLPFLDKSMGFEGVRREISKPRPVIPVNNPNAIVTLETPPVNPQLFNLIGYLSSWMENKAGGKNFLGHQEYASESGRAVLARAEQGGLFRLGTYERLKNWRREVAYMLIYFAKYFMKTQQVIRIVGEENVPIYVELDEELMDSIRELKYDIIVDETFKSETMKERYFQQVRELAQVVPYPPEVLMPILIRFSNLPKTTQEELLRAMSFFQEYQQKQKQQEHELKLHQQAEDSAKRRIIREGILRQEEIQQTSEALKKKTQELKEQLQELEDLKQKIESVGPAFYSPPIEQNQDNVQQM